MHDKGHDQGLAPDSTAVRVALWRALRPPINTEEVLVAKTWRFTF